MTTFTYPHFQPTVVGLSPSLMKQLSPADMDALCCAFQALTFEDPLGPDRSPALLWEEFKRRSRVLDPQIAEATAKAHKRYWQAYGDNDRDPPA